MVLPSADSDKLDYGTKEDEVAPIMMVSVDPGKPDRNPREDEVAQITKASIDSEKPDSRKGKIKKWNCNDC